jgi:NADH-quinone oxidoreductase subunit L
MTFVLIILSFFAATIGYIGLPHLFYHGKGVFNVFHRWLEPIVSISESKIHVLQHRTGLEWGLMGISYGLALFSLAWAWKWYRKEVNVNTKVWAEALKPVYKLLLNKYFVDEIYYWLIDKLILQFSHKVLWKTIDYIIIDNLIINGLLAGGSKTLGFLLGLFQTGKLQFYAFVMVAAFFFIFYFMTL